MFVVKRKTTHMYTVLQKGLSDTNSLPVSILIDAALFCVVPDDGVGDDDWQSCSFVATLEAGVFVSGFPSLNSVSLSKRSSSGKERVELPLAVIRLPILSYFKHAEPFCVLYNGLRGVASLGGLGQADGGCKAVDMQPEQGLEVAFVECWP
ncbi:hypothetical protein FF38_04902 [Lucilia cuprina]|uniref:Uncharacterized protein n=1 Tax=Lucilia cuprina TaxID=7375 RepID=A0A0L0CAZ8_LUCCU|nr:hypothetical protein FF38_04902 [Lucilia cuprina]